MRPEGPTAETLAKIDRVRELLRADNKLVWACAEEGLSVQTWYRRQVYLRREIVTQKVKAVRAAVAMGERVTKACRDHGLSYVTYNWRVARKGGCHG